MGQLCLACIISSVNLLAKRARIVEWSGPIYRPNVPITQDFELELEFELELDKNTVLFPVLPIPSG